jgi:hypothetical protein
MYFSMNTRPSPNADCASRCAAWIAEVRSVPRPTGNDRHTRIREELLRGELIAHRADDIRAGADKRQPRVGTGLSELRVFRQEPVAGMNGVDAVPPGDLDDPLAAKVGLGRGLAFERVGLIRREHVRRPPIGLRVHRHRPQPHLLHRPRNPNGNLSAIGD